MESQYLGEPIWWQPNVERTCSFSPILIHALLPKLLQLPYRQSYRASCDEEKEADEETMVPLRDAVAHHAAVVVEALHAKAASATVV